MKLAGDSAGRDYRPDTGTMVPPRRPANATPKIAAYSAIDARQHGETTGNAENPLSAAKWARKQAFRYPKRYPGRQIGRRTR